MTLLEAVRRAREALESVLCDPEGNVCWHGSYADRDIIGDALTTLRQALEQPAQQEPVAWMYDIARYGPTDLRGQQWRPAISRTKPNMHDSLVRDLTPLYTRPQAREPLTDEQCEEAIRTSGLWPLACVTPQNKALLIGLCRAAHGITPQGETK